PALGGGTHLCLAEPQPTPGQGCRSNGRERRDLALYCQRQADVAPSGCRMIDASEIFHAQSDLCHYKADSSQTLRAEKAHRIAAAGPYFLAWSPASQPVPCTQYSTRGRVAIKLTISLVKYPSLSPCKRRVPCPADLTRCTFSRLAACSPPPGR